jgi:hypothetical protein
MLACVGSSGLAEQVDLEDPVTSSTTGKPEESQRHSYPPSSSRVSNHVESQPSTQTTTDEINLSVPPGLHPEADPPIFAAPQTRGAKNGRRGLKGRTSSLLTFSKKKGALETLKRNCAVMDSEAVGDAEEVLELLEPPSTILGSMMFPSESSMETSLQDREGNATAAKQTSHDDTESRLLADHEEQNRPSPPSIE